MPPGVNLDRRPRTPWERTRPPNADWFEIPARRQRRASSSPTSPAAGARPQGTWPHVGGDGAVTAFTGRVRTAARTTGRPVEKEGLFARRVPLSGVGLVMGDTNLCPHNQGRRFRSRLDARMRGASCGPSGRRRAGLIDGLVLRGTSGGDRRAHIRRTADCSRVPTQPADEGRGAVGRAGDWRALVDPAGRPAPHRAMDRTAGGALPMPIIVLPGMRHGQVLRPPAVGATAAIGGASARSRART